MKVSFIYDPIYIKHDTGQHVENAGRLDAIIFHLEQTGLKQQLIPIKPRSVSVAEISLVHDKRYISHIQNTAQKGGGWLNSDTVISPDSYQAAIYAAGGAIKAAEAVIDGEIDSAFALVSPPWHHAAHRQAMGFCLFNNVAIAAKHILVKYKLDRIAIIDFDVHHGNGTQEAFYEDPRVLYISTHEYPHYPGTGSIEETGIGDGEGTTVNIPLPAGCGDAQYSPVFEQIVVPAVKRFNPELILVSAGYDTHWADGLALMQVSATGFAQMVKIIKGLADELCRGRLVFTLEGGYNPTALATSVKATFDMLLDNAKIEDPLGQSSRWSEAPDITHLIKSIKEINNLA